MPRSITRLRFILRHVWEKPERIRVKAVQWAGGRIYPKYRRPAVVLCNCGGWGDVVMVTAVAREVRKRNSRTMIHVVTTRPAVFDRNPDVDFVNRLPRPDVPWRSDFKLQYHHHFPWKRHFLYSMCECVDIRDEITLRTYLYPNEPDVAFANDIVSRLGVPPIVFARNGKSGEGRKNWPTAYWEQLAQNILKYAPVVDTGHAGDPLDIRHNGYLDLQGKTTFHQLSALLSKARALITMDAAPNHMAAAFSLPTVCLLGGVFPAAAIQYPNGRVLSNRPECCDCWPVGKCTRNLECMADIRPADVLDALQQVCPELNHRVTPPARGAVSDLSVATPAS